ncbi:hypothetical protein D1871_22985 [Nakamurella silvestris]|nr:hypothetical protein D1871_22985 [Nakamurella silvestris]
MPARAETRDQQIGPADLLRFYKNIQAGIHLAESNETIISDDTAQDIRRVLAAILGLDWPNLHTPSDTGRVAIAEHERALQDALRLFDDPELTAELAPWIGWLAAWTLAFRAVQNSRPPSFVNGNAIRGYLLLPNVDCKSPSILKDFEDQYSGSFSSMAELVDQLSMKTRMDELVAQFASSHGLQGLVRVDLAAVRRLVLQTWDTAVVDGAFYAYLRPLVRAE